MRTDPELKNENVRMKIKNVGYIYIKNIKKHYFIQSISLNQSKQSIFEYYVVPYIFTFTNDGNKNHLQNHFENHLIACLFLKSLNF